MISAAVFLIVGGAFVLGLLKGIFALLGYDFNAEGLNAKTVYKIFKIPIISFLALMIYVLWVLPYLTTNGYG